MPPEWFPGAPSPNWEWWVVLESAVAGVAAGAFLTAAFAHLAGTEADHRATRSGYVLALLLVLTSAVLLTVDLDRPERFWHMLFESARMPLPIFKPWSPMSVGSWALFLFGGVAFLLAVGALLGRDRAGKSLLGKVLAVIGVVMAFVVAAYQGALVSTTNQPVWTQSSWFAPLLVVASMLAGMAAVALLLPGGALQTAAKIRSAMTWLMAAELILILVLLVSLGVMARAYLAPPGLISLAVVVVVGLLAPLALQVFGPRQARGSLTTAAVLVLVGSFALRYALWMAPVQAQL